MAVQCSWWDDGWQINCSQGADLHGQVSASHRNFFKCHHHLLEENGITVNNIPRAFFLELVVQLFNWEKKWTCKSIFGFEECRKDDLVNSHVTWVKAQIHLFADSLIIWDWHYQDKAKPSGKGMCASFLHTWTMDEAMRALNNRLIWGTIWSE